MKKKAYLVTMTETLWMEFPVDARSREEAERIIEQKWSHGEYVPGSEGVIRTEYKAQALE
jgi:hypothetical protein